MFVSPSHQSSSVTLDGGIVCQCNAGLVERCRGGYHGVDKASGTPVLLGRLLLLLLLLRLLLFSAGVGARVIFR